MSVSGFTILQVEDDPDDIFLMKEAVLRAGMLAAPQVARDGEEALAYLQGRGEYADRSRHPLPSLILLDLKLPRISGLEVLQWLRQQPGLKRIPVIVMSSSAQAGDIDRAYDLGTNSYLVKPVDAADLQTNINSVRAFWVDLNKSPTTA